MPYSPFQNSGLGLVSGIPPFVLQPDYSARMEFRFAPAAVSIRQAQFTVFTQAEALLRTARGVVTLALAGQNPAGEQAEIELETTESGRTTLVLFDTGGREVRRYIAGEVSTGRRTVSLDMRGIPPGLYLLTLQTPTETRTVQVRITR